MNLIQKIQNVGLSRWLAWMLIGLGVLLVVLLIFDAGVAVGMRRSIRMRGLSEMSRGQPPQFGFGSFGVSMPHGFIPDGHGAVGAIISISLPTLVIQTRDGTSEEVLLTASTTIRGTTTLTQTDLHVGDKIVALGNPNAATSSQRLEAELIRVLSQPPMPQ